MERAAQTVADRMLLTYQWVLLPSADDPARPFEIRAVKADTPANASLPERVTRKLGNEGELATELSAPAIRLALDSKVPAVWKSGHVSVGRVWELMTSYPYMPRVTNRAVLDDGLTRAVTLTWTHDAYAWADGYDEATGRYQNLILPEDERLPLITDHLLLVKPDAATAQRNAELLESIPDDTPLGTSTWTPGETATIGDLEPYPGWTQFPGSKTLSELYSVDWAKVAREVIDPLVAAGAEVDVRVEIEAHLPAGFTDATVRTVRENADTLKFDHSGFEET